MGHALGERERCVNQRKAMVELLVKYIFGGEVGSGAILAEQLTHDDGSLDPTKDSMAAVSRISKVLSDLKREGQNIFTDLEVRKRELREEIGKMRNKVRDIKGKERDLMGGVGGCEVGGGG